ncbi:VWA domain-containing protein [Roseibacillus persicicus]|uniref:Chloride channel protein n=1 Tax=Roseibacillus persicicus TaxID=454148 RepID=A0A918TWM4_9BACT|nr:VWA domain-containing protein [Roseibacillus persicicus]GHC60017.1 chloride channel protein [Roseibacillus persicicus]
MIEFLTLTPLWALLLIPVLGAAFFVSLVDRPPLMKWASFLCRIFAVLLLIFALCRPFWVRKSDDLHLVYLLDASESVEATALREALQEIEKANSRLTADDSWSLFLFGATAKAMTPEEVETFVVECEKGQADAAFRSASDLEGALSEIRLAFPANKARRVVVFSDGAVEGNLDRVMAQLKDEQTDLRFRKMPGRTEPEAAIEEFEALTSVAFEGELTRLRVRLMANKTMKANLRILHRGVAVAEKGVELVAGKTTVENVDVEMVTAGESVWEAELVPEEDHFAINNKAALTISVRGRPRVLVIHDESEKMRAAARSLREQGIELDLRGARGLPDSLRGMLAFDGIVLADVPATSLRPEQMRWLNDYVTKFGGGLVMLGSENSFGIGGYYRTPVEDVLPLVSRFEKEKEKPSLAMVLVIDKSGSMSGEPIVMARQAARATAELLSGRDQIAVLGFDSQPQLICDLTMASAQAQIASAIDSLEAGGGTDLQPAMVQAREILEGASAKIKHVIAMTDGQTEPANLVELSQEMADAGMTVSTVALGGGAAGGLLSEMADAGRGRYYEAAEAQEVPQIFTRETMQASRSAIKEDLYASAPVTDHPMMAGYESVEFPFVLGYVMTRAKPTAQVLLAAESGDPLLAVGRFGLGTGVAFTADLTERWGGEWLAWEGFGSFWAQILRGSLKKDNSVGLGAKGEVANGRWQVEVLRNDEAGRPLGAVEWDAEVFDENGKSRPVELQEVGLGRYFASVEIGNAQRLAMRLTDSVHGKSKTLQWAASYPAEYRLKQELPAQIATTIPFESAKIREGYQEVRVRRSALPWFGFGALLFLMAGLVLRRI